MQLSSDTTALVRHCAHSVAVRAASGCASNMPIERRWDSITSPISATSDAGRRLTFRIDAAEREIYDVNLEAYH